MAMNAEIYVKKKNKKRKVWTKKIDIKKTNI